MTRQHEMPPHRACILKETYLMEFQILTQEEFSQLPAFVRQYLEELIKDDCQFEEEEEEWVQREQQMLAATAYANITGTVDHPYSDISKQVNFWIASHDHVLIHLHIGGSGCWINPNSHYLFFSPIAAELLPPEPDRQTWWAIVYDERAHHYCIYQIHVRPEAGVADTFPDIG